MGTNSLSQAKMNNVKEYIEECKGIIDAPTKLLLINEVAHAMNSIQSGALEAQLSWKAYTHDAATQFVNDIIVKNTEKN